MATEKELKLIISEEGGDTVKKQIKEIKIEALSAKKLMQEVVDDIPSAAAKAGKSLDEFSKRFKGVSNSLNKHYTTADELHKSFITSASNKALTERMTKLTSEAAQLTLTMEQIQNLNEKAYKTLEQTTDVKLTANQSELDGLAKNAKSLDQLMTKYEERNRLLADRAEVAKAAANAEYEEMKKAGADAVLVEQHKADKIKAIDTKLTEDRKQNAKNYATAAKAYNDKLFDSITQNIEVTVDRSAKKTKKLAQNTEKAAKKMAEEIRMQFGLAEGALDDIAIAAMQAQEKSKAATAEAAKTAEAATKTAEAAKKIIDIDATHKNIKLAIEGLDHYRTTLYTAYSNYIKTYNKNLEAAKGNAEEIKKLEKEKADATKFYVEEIVKTNQTLTAVEKMQQDLSVVQLRQYANNVSSIMSDVSKTYTEASKSVTGVIDSLKTADKERLDQMNADWLTFNEDNKEKIAEGVKVTAEIKELEEKKAAAAIAGNQREAEAIQATIDAKKKEHQTAIKINEDSLNKKKEHEEKTKEIDNRNRKRDKLKKKIELSQNIISGISNVALAVTKAMTAGPIIGQILAGITAAAGAIQVGILTTQLSKMQDGGLLKGKRHAQGGMRIEGTNIEVEGGEYVVNRVSTDKNIGLIRYINSQRREVSPADVSAFFTRSSQGFEPPFSRAFEAGGQLPAVDNPGSVDNESLVEAIRAIRIEPRVSVTDIDRVRNEMVSVDGWVGL